MKKKNSYRWLIWIFLAVILIGVALWNILPPYIDRRQSTKDYEKLAEEYVSDESEPDDGKQKKKDWCWKQSRFRIIKRVLWDFKNDTFLSEQGTKGF